MYSSYQYLVQSVRLWFVLIAILMCSSTTSPLPSSLHASSSSYLHQAQLFKEQKKYHMAQKYFHATIDLLKLEYLEEMSMKSKYEEHGELNCKVFQDLAGFSFLFSFVFYRYL